MRLQSDSGAHDSAVVNAHSFKCTTTAITSNQHLNPPAAALVSAAKRAPFQPSDSAMAFADTLKTLPGVAHLAALQLIDNESGTVVSTIEHKPGQIGSLAVYNHLAATFGAITPGAAARGLEIYGEHTADARANPGKHPNVDRLIALSASGKTLRVKSIPAAAA